MYVNGWWLLAVGQSSRHRDTGRDLSLGLIDGLGRGPGLLRWWYHDMVLTRTVDFFGFLDLLLLLLLFNGVSRLASSVVCDAFCVGEARRGVAEAGCWVVCAACEGLCS